MENRFGGQGLYIFDEPEAALSPVNQLVLVRHICRLVKEGSQFLISTHSPVLLCIPGAQIYELSREKGRAFCACQAEETALFRFYSGFKGDAGAVKGRMIAYEKPSVPIGAEGFSERYAKRFLMALFCF